MTLEYGHDPVCPYCGFIDCDAWMINFENRSQINTPCRSCGKMYILFQHSSIIYATKAIETSKEARSRRYIIHSLAEMLMDAGFDTEAKLQELLAKIKKEEDAKPEMCPECCWEAIKKGLAREGPLCEGCAAVPHDTSEGV